MTKDDAIEELMYQSGNHENFESERWQKGFLRQLRPFKGILYEENYHLIMRSIKVLASEMEKDFIDKRMINTIWGICHLARMWELHPEGILQSNNLITEQQILQIDNWLIDISYATNCLLDGARAEEAFFDYEEN